MFELVYAATLVLYGLSYSYYTLTKKGKAIMNIQMQKSLKEMETKGISMNPKSAQNLNDVLSFILALIPGLNTLILIIFTIKLFKGEYNVK